MSNTFNDRFLNDLAGLSDDSGDEHQAEDFADLPSNSEKQVADINTEGEIEVDESADRLFKDAEFHEHLATIETY
jgi:hypothetical protein